MNYIFISFDAIKEISSTHQLQSSDFKEGNELCDVIRGHIDSWEKFNIFFQKKDNGGFFFTKNPYLKKGIIFDLTTFKDFEANKNDQIITIFQKVLKFTIRYFEKLPPAFCEKHIAGSSTSLVFPFPFVATKDSYRVLIDRDSEKTRYEKRDKQYLLVYAGGYTDVAQTTPSYTNLHKAIESADNVCKYDKKKEVLEIGEKIDSLKLTSLDIKDLSITSSIGFDHWKRYLTSNQESFINKPVTGPERLEGAAGTGKTLTMILRCINLIKQKYESSQSYHILFITHSISTKNQITDIFRLNFEEADLFLDKTYSSISITITTLQEWCINFLGNNLGSSEYLDRDAQDSKELQKMYLNEAFLKALENDFSTYKHICSDKFINFIENSKEEDLLEMLQHEIAVTIKGRAGEDLEKYKNLPRLKYSIPCEKDGDLSYLYLIYQKYQDLLKLTNQFDSDDIIITSLGQLNTPIWRRRRDKEGYDVSFIDETHLFNLNELSIFHFLNKEIYNRNIVFTIDKSQAVGDRGLVDDILFDALGFNHIENSSSLKLNTVFRSSPDIVNLAFNVLSSGATLFTNFENPLDKVSYRFTEKEEKKAKQPRFISKEDDETIVIEAFQEAEKLTKDLDTQKSRILIIATTEMLLAQLEQIAKKSNKPIEILKSRGDMEAVKSATKKNRFLIAGIDYVGGLEFDGVIMVGVDKGRVPPNYSENTESSLFLSYAWHNRMYVAITRAKFAIIMFGDKSRGESKLLESSISSKLLIVD